MPKVRTKILCLCDEGNNRSVHLAHPLKYWGNDVLAAGFNNSPSTLDMLYDWADIILLTDKEQLTKVRQHAAKTHICSIGPDRFARPFNAELHRLVKRFLDDNKALLDNR